MNQNQIHILEPNGVRRSRPIPPQGLTIGRGSENDIVLAYEAVSRAHAQITFEQGYYYVIDFNSANGTFIDNLRLPPHTPTIWWPKQSLRIGGATITLELVQTQRRQPADLDQMETRIGWVPGEAQQPSVQKPQQLALILTVVGVICLCLCAGLAVASYYFMGL
ncbi:MAG: FHA domain-containing protein [Anaerolineales bacterium]|nr:FHA domain-containing protein [Anaerolineales bacterium]